MRHPLFNRISKLAIGFCLAGAAVAGCASTPEQKSAPEKSVPEKSAPELSYNVTEGLNINSFTREGPVAAHLLLRSGEKPRILVAFPAGNSGVGLWFEQTPQPVAWKLLAAPQPLTINDSKQRPLHGISFEAEVSAPKLVAKDAVLSNVRILRDYQALGTIPQPVVSRPTSNATSLTYARDRIDGAPGYQLKLEVIEGRVDGETINANSAGIIRLKVTALTGDPPLTPIFGDALLNADAAPIATTRNALSFLSYKEKFLAGSWRFNTYFGRDTLMSVMLLMPVLQPNSVEAGLSSVLARQNNGGEVSHEEAISEFILLDRMRRGVAVSDADEEDYGMVDDDYMLASVAAHYLLDSAAGRQRIAAFLAAPRKAGDAITNGAALVANLNYVVGQAQPFVDAPSTRTLIGIKDGRTNGQWRDSSEGLGDGKYAYDVNAVFVPAALKAIGRLAESGELNPYLNAEQKARFAKASSMAIVWRDRAVPMFDVALAPEAARGQVSAYARSVGVPEAPALQSIPNDGLKFSALSLNPDGSKVPIVHTDEGFALLFTEPPVDRLERAVTAVMRPFPAGLLTDVGVVVANPAFADARLQSRFTKNAYHGTVIWSWQQAVLAAGLEHQLKRTDLPAATRAKLMAAQGELWRVINSARAVQNSELWSWAVKDGRYEVAAFGASGADVDESNAAQLWSTVYLAVKPPK
jgi:hypothetical protein